MPSADGSIVTKEPSGLPTAEEIQEVIRLLELALQDSYRLLKRVERSEPKGAEGANNFTG